MILNKDFESMIQAKHVGQLTSNCGRRKIGVYIPLNSPELGDIAFTGSNATQSTKQCCGSATNGICTAIHAEVNAVVNLRGYRYLVDSLYIWAETPCHNCLSFIRRYSHITKIYCLSTESYGIEYPRVNDRTSEIRLRDEYAADLGFQIHKLDVKEIEEYGKRNCNNSED